MPAQRWGKRLCNHKLGNTDKNQIKKLRYKIEQRIYINMKKITLGILAHVDSGKTTLSEAFLYATGKIRKLGRVNIKMLF